MKFISTIIGCILFVLFFGFALKNMQEVDLHFFLHYDLHGPLVLMLVVAMLLLARARRRPRLMQYVSLPLAMAYLMRGIHF